MPWRLKDGCKFLDTRETCDVSHDWLFKKWAEEARILEKEDRESEARWDAKVAESSARRAIKIEEEYRVAEDDKFKDYKLRMLTQSAIAEARRSITSDDLNLKTFNAGSIEIYLDIMDSMDVAELTFSGSNVAISYGLHGDEYYRFQRDGLYGRVCAKNNNRFAFIRKAEEFCAENNCGLKRPYIK